MKMIKFLLLALVVLAVSPVQAAERTINVEGTGVAAAKPDTAEIRISVAADKKTAKEAVGEASNKERAVLKALADSGIANADIQTGSISMRPVYPPRKPNMTPEEAQKVIGFRASIDNRVKIRKLDSLGKLLDAMSKVGADRMDSVRFFVSNPAGMHAEARKQAVLEAMDKAQQLAQAAGIELGEIVNITDATPSRPLPQPRMMAMSSAESGVPIMPGLITVQVHVQMVYAIK